MEIKKEYSSLGTIKLTMDEFNKLSALVYEECGIKLPPTKKVMLESRLVKRLRAHNMTTFREYMNYLLGKEGMANELIQMIDVVTTNKTDFFREPHHFQFLTDTILPQYIKDANRSIKIWSAACSSGEEPYTLAMVLQEFARLHRGFDYSIFGSDISTDVLEKAVLAVYALERANDIPVALRPKYLLKSKDKIKPTVRIVPELRKKVRFGRVNFMDTVLSVDEKFDIIFCRNVLIYFDRQTQIEVVSKLLGNLKPGGYFFIGHSESLYQTNLPIEQILPTIYKKK